MAQSGQTITQPLVGPALPAIRQQGGYFATRSGDLLAWGDLIVAAFTPIGSRPMARSFGSGMSRIVFSPNTPQLAQSIDYVIRTAVASWAPTVRVVSVTVGQRPNNTEVQVLVQFQQASSSAVQGAQSVTIPLSSIVKYLAAAQSARG